ncbi:MAG: cell cycle RNA binding protein whi3, partial [Phylliscum demangeonii]
MSTTLSSATGSGASMSTAPPTHHSTTTTATTTSRPKASLPSALSTSSLSSLALSPSWSQPQAPPPPHSARAPSMPSPYGAATSIFAPLATTTTTTTTAAAVPAPGPAFPSYGMSTIGEGAQYHVDAPYRSHHLDPDGARLAAGAGPGPDADAARAASEILIRKLSRNMTDKELRSMFLFAKEFLESEFVSPELPEDRSYVSAVARFKTAAAAHEAQQMLDGRPNTATEANMIVQVVHSAGPPANLHRRNTVDGTVHRVPSTSASASSSAASNGGVASVGLSAVKVRASSRFNASFPSLESISPPAPGHGASTDFPFPDPGSHMQRLFTPQSPVAGAGAGAGDGVPRVTGKSVINDHSPDDDETGELLKDPVAYAKHGHASAAAAVSRSRRPTNPAIPVAHFAGLALTSAAGAAASVPAYAAARTGP